MRNGWSIFCCTDFLKVIIGQRGQIWPSGKHRWNGNEPEHLIKSLTTVVICVGSNNGGFLVEMVRDYGDIDYSYRRAAKRRVTDFFC